MKSPATVTAGQKILATYHWTDAIVSSPVSRRSKIWAKHWQAVSEVAKRLSSVLQGLHGIEIGAEIVQGLADPQQETIVRRCLALGNSLSIPEVGLGLALPPTTIPADLAGELKSQAKKLRAIIGGGGGGSPPPIRAIAETADCYEKGSVPMKRILHLLKCRRGMMCEDAMDHPLLQLAFASYVGIEELRQQLNRHAFQEGGPLAAQRKKWEWVVKREPVEIAT